MNYAVACGDAGRVSPQIFARLLVKRRPDVFEARVLVPSCHSPRSLVISKLPMRFVRLDRRGYGGNFITALRLDDEK